MTSAQQRALEEYYPTRYYNVVEVTDETEIREFVETEGGRPIPDSDMYRLSQRNLDGFGTKPLIRVCQISKLPEGLQKELADHD